MVSRPAKPDDHHEGERPGPGAVPKPPQREDKSDDGRRKHDAALPGSQNSDLRGAKRDRTLRGATT
jgi:hypothetical protein